ncbi:MAG: hypothetical protein KAG84_03625 [Bacteroidales bacterium]|nr:hypothetical protein [Bacteroidales bacterium]
MKTKEDIIKAIMHVQHPAIAYSLLELGIINNVQMKDNTAIIYFAFPFPKIPIAMQLINSIAFPVESLGVEFEYEIADMSEVAKERFMKMEKAGWIGKK